MILTITPNPSIDYLFEAEALCWDDANRVEMPRRRAGGQGINLTRAARVLGGESVALAFFGGSAGQQLKDMLQAEQTPFIDVPIAAETRVFFGVREVSTGRSMLVNARGAILGREDEMRLLDSVRHACQQLRPAWVVCCGSVPRGLSTDLYAQIGDIAHSHDARFVTDCDGAQLTSAVARGCDLIAPNQHEAERLTYTSIADREAAIQAAHSLRGVANEVFVKLGAAGAVATSQAGCWVANGPELQSGSAVGAGDAFLAAALVAKQNGAPLDEALRAAVAAGTAVLRSSGSDLLTHSDYDQLLHAVEVTRVSAV
jgi:1-phosphofructokinase family hexose kinase